MRGVLSSFGAVALITLAGCASKGVVTGTGEFPSQTFEVKTDYEAAHRRAAEFLRVCHVDREHPFGVGYIASPTIDTKGTIATLRLAQTDQPIRNLLVIESEPSGARTATVHVTVIGEQQWDDAQIEAAKQSIQTATPVCRT